MDRALPQHAMPGISAKAPPQLIQGTNFADLTSLTVCSIIHIAPVLLVSHLATPCNHHGPRCGPDHQVLKFEVLLIPFSNVQTGLRNAILRDRIGMAAKMASSLPLTLRCEGWSISAHHSLGARETLKEAGNTHPISSL